jgi:hypothetical protein
VESGAETAELDSIRVLIFKIIIMTIGNKHESQKKSVTDLRSAHVMLGLKAKLHQGQI